MHTRALNAPTVLIDPVQHARTSAGLCVQKSELLSVLSTYRIHHSASDDHSQH